MLIGRFVAWPQLTYTRGSGLSPGLTSGMRRAEYADARWEQRSSTREQRIRIHRERERERERERSRAIANASASTGSAFVSAKRLSLSAPIKARKSRGPRLEAARLPRDWSLPPSPPPSRGNRRSSRWEELPEKLKPRVFDSSSGSDSRVLADCEIRLRADAAAALIQFSKRDRLAGASEAKRGKVTRSRFA